MLREAGYGNKIGNTIQLRHARFQDEADSIIEFIKKKNPRNGRSIFMLDQYGYKEAPTQLIKHIFANLPNAEVILTFAVDSFLNYAADSKLTQSLLSSIGVPDILQGRSFEEIKSSEKHWRLFIQSTLYRALVDRCGAKYYTPFFIRNKKGHGDYWLIHLSQHYKARDVMTEVHWQYNNNFIHYGGPGLNMFQIIGYDPVFDAAYLGQSALGFEFDDVARKSSVSTLVEQIPRLIYSNDEGLSFGMLFATTCNGSPASAKIYRESIGKLLEEKLVEIVSEDGVKRRSANQRRSGYHAACDRPATQQCRGRHEAAAKESVIVLNNSGGAWETEIFRAPQIFMRHDHVPKILIFASYRRSIAQAMPGEANRYSTYHR